MKVIESKTGSNHDHIIREIVQALSALQDKPTNELLKELGYAHLMTNHPQNDKTPPRIDSPTIPGKSSPRPKSIPTPHHYRCSHCGTDNIESAPPEVASDWRIVYSRELCFDCGHRWDNVFIFQGQHNEALDCNYEDLAKDFTLT